MAVLHPLTCIWRQASRSGLLTLWLGLASRWGGAAPLPPDSLLRALRTAAPDTERVKTAQRLAVALSATDTARAGFYARYALGLSSRSHFGYGLANGWLQLSTLAITRRDVAAAARYGQRAQAVADSLAARATNPRLQLLRAGIANNRGNVADLLGHYAEATGYYVQAADLLAATPNTGTLLAVYCNLGNSFRQLGQYAQAARYWRQALALSAPPTAELLPVRLQLTSLHLQAAHPDSAWQQLQAARQLLGLEHLYAGEYYGTLAQYYVATGQLAAARQAYQQALPLATHKGAAGYQAGLLFGLGQLEAQDGNLGHARNLLQRSLVLTEQVGDQTQLLPTLDGLARLEEAAGQYQAALHYTQRAQQLRDTLTSTATRRQINQLEAHYRTRQQAQQLQAARQTQAAQQLALRQQRHLNTAYLAVLLLLVGGGAAGLLLLRHRQRLAQQARGQERALLTAQAVLRGQDEERRRVARDLHDGLGGMLATVKLYLASIRTRGGLPAESAQLFQQSIDHLDSSVAELRRVARNLMPEALLSFGLGPALHDLCQAVQQAGGVPVQLTTHGLVPRLPASTEVELYRIVQELLNNALRHAHAQQLVVQLMRHASELHLVVEDDGCGFDTRAAGVGVGLRSVQARAHYLGGQLEVQSQHGQGTSVSLELRVPAAIEAAPADSSISFLAYDTDTGSAG